MNKDLFFINNLRQDGRKKNEIRNFDVQMGELTEASGSAQVSMGETKAVAWVEGPREGKSKLYENKGVLKCTFSIAPFASITRKKDYKRDLKMREFSKTLKDIFEQIIMLELYPRSEVALNVLILQNDGSYKSAAVNALTAALINAGILIKDTAVAANVGLIGQAAGENTPVYDLQLQEEKENIPLLNVAYLPHFKKFIFLELLNAKTPYEQTDLLLREGKKASIKVFEVLEKFLKYDYLIK